MTDAQLARIDWLERYHYVVLVNNGQIRLYPLDKERLHPPVQYRLTPEGVLTERKELK